MPVSKARDSLSSCEIGREGGKRVHGVETLDWVETLYLLRQDQVDESRHLGPYENTPSILLQRHKDLLDAVLGGDQHL